MTANSKPTTQSMAAALRAALTLQENASAAAMRLHAARSLFEADAPERAIQELGRARECLAGLRRTQMAALENIEAGK